jgi:DNA polymerase I-like protein with 3'-5' exonuclease and polymerase domains
MVPTKDIQSQIVTTVDELLNTIVYKEKDLVVADIETYNTNPEDGKLLGIALAPVYSPQNSIYIVLQWYDFKTSTWFVNPNREALLIKLRNWFRQADLIGHNYTYDKLWLDHILGVDTKWTACTRVMWHMASAPAGPRPYGLKDAQCELLKWDRRGDVGLTEQVEARGGKLSAGDHYLADIEVLGHYACLDAASTALLFQHLTPFFDKHDYWWMLDKMTRYSLLLQQCTTNGIKVDISALEEQANELTVTKEAHISNLLEELAPYVARLERLWVEDTAAKYTSEAAKKRFLGSWEMQRKVKLSSDKDKRELFYDAMGLPVVVKTEGGKGSTSVEGIKAAIAKSGRTDLSQILESYVEAEGAEALLSGFVKPWLNAVRNGRLHPRFNPCGTVSYRLSGFKPYLLNAPFDEKGVMSTLKCDEGWGGVHADFTSVEPAVTAHYSQDPSLLKVFRDGLGDVYLDLALALFPQDAELNSFYETNAPITPEVKARFKKQRNVAKTIQLAVQYTGTGQTVFKNLNAAGHAVTLPEAFDMVAAYWKHFHKVAIMNEALFIKNERQGYLRNVVGRVIQVPKGITILKRDGTIWEKPIRYKDLPNRFIQSSAHDLLSFWAMKIDDKCRERGLTVKSVIVDCHDSTTWQCPLDQVHRLEEVYVDALRELNEEIRMSVPIKAEIKRFQTLAGLKGTE